MAESARPAVHAVVVVEEELRFTLEDLCHACRADAAQLTSLVREGVLEPAGERPDEWRFAGDALARARTAVRLSRDLELTVGGTALVMDLLDEIDALRARLRRVGG
jgi:chaperone modulatory protein CbpM